MQWKMGRRSDNVEDARGSGIGGGSLSLGAVAIAVVLGLVTGHNPMEFLGLLSDMSGSPTQEAGAPPAGDEAADFVRAILGTTEDVWVNLFEREGATYDPPHLVLFSGQVRSGCGGASSATGPFYCPQDRKVYLDMSFFQEMQQHLGGGGEFADAYVIAHEVGHHVQTLLGTTARMEQAAQGGASMKGDTGLSVRLELQADCYAGVWAQHAQAQLHWLDSGDVEKALNTASAIGDDRLQQQGQGRVAPDTFTHGTSAQRVRWFRKGFDGGQIGGCDTFSASAL